jgi:hypothetical protein
VATVVAAAEPFTSDASLSAKLATAAINLVLGGRVVARGWDREPFTAGTPFTDRKAAGCRGSLVPFGRLSRRTCLSRWLFVLLLDFSGSRCSLENVCRVRVVRQNDWVPRPGNRPDQPVPTARGDLPRVPRGRRRTRRHHASPLAPPPYDLFRGAL